MAMTSGDDFVAGLAGGYQQSFSFSTPTVAAGTTPLSGIQLASGWQTGIRSGVVPSGFLIPELCTNDTPGAMPLPALTAGNQWYLGAVGVGAWNQVALYDRLAQVRIDPSTAGANSITGGLARPARSTTALGVSAFMEISTVAATAGPQFTVLYTDHTGTPGKVGYFNTYATTKVDLGLGAQGVLLPLVAAAGTQGISSIQSVTTTLTSDPGVDVTCILHLSRCVFTWQSPLQHSSVQAGFFDAGAVSLGTDPCLFAAGGASLSTAMWFGTARLFQA